VIIILRLTPKNQPKRGDRRARQNKSPNMVVSIPKLISSLRVTKTFRYLASLALSAPTPITRGFLLNQLVLNKASSTSSWRLPTAVRLIRIRAYLNASSTVWNGSVSLTTVPQVAVTWASGNSPSETLTESNGGSTMSTCVFKPPRGSLAGFWSSSGVNESEVVLYIQTAVGITFDVTYEMILTTNDQVPSSVATAASGVAGTQYACYFDGPNTGASLVPVGLPSIN
jgi:hypothetical protein